MTKNYVDRSSKLRESVVDGTLSDSDNSDIEDILASLANGIDCLDVEDVAQLLDFSSGSEDFYEPPNDSDNSRRRKKRRPVVDKAGPSCAHPQLAPAQLLDFSSGSEEFYEPPNEYDSDDSRRGKKRKPVVDKAGPSCAHPQFAPSIPPLSPNILFPNQSQGLPSPYLPDPSPSPSPPPQSPTSQNSSPDPQPTRANEDFDRPWTRVYREDPFELVFDVRNPGPRNCPLSHEPVEYFHLFMPESFFQTMTRETNVYANCKRANQEKAGKLTPRSRLFRWHNVSIDEMKKFIAVMLNMGLTNRQNYSDYWSNDPLEYIPWFPNTMSRNRFQALHANVHLTSRRGVPSGHPDYDPWVKVRPLLDVCNRKFKEHYIPNQDLSIDESMIGMRNQYAFIMYMPNKRHVRYGIKKFELVDSKSSFVVHVELYSGKDFMSEDPDPLTKKVVYNLLRSGNCLNKGYHVFTGNFYTNLLVALQLYDSNTFMTGTVNKRSKDLSKQVVSTSFGREESFCFRKGPVLMIGYKQKPTRKTAYLLTTAYHAEKKMIMSRSGIVAKKPITIDWYNRLMGVVDIKDKQVYHLSCTRRTTRYWKKIFFNFLDMCIHNAFIVYKAQCEGRRALMSRKDFILEVVRALSSTLVALPAAPAPGGNHIISHLPGNKMRICNLCGSGKGRTRFWCAGCNVGVHKACFHRLEHFQRPTQRGRKRKADTDSSDDS